MDKITEFSEIVQNFYNILSNRAEFAEKICLYEEVIAETQKLSNLLKKSMDLNSKKFLRDQKEILIRRLLEDDDVFERVVDTLFDYDYVDEKTKSKKLQLTKYNSNDDDDEIIQKFLKNM